MRHCVLSIPQGGAKRTGGKGRGLGSGDRVAVPPVFHLLPGQPWVWRAALCLALGCRDASTLNQIQAVHTA